MPSLNSTPFTTFEFQVFTDFLIALLAGETTICEIGKRNEGDTRQNPPIWEVKCGGLLPRVSRQVRGARVCPNLMAGRWAGAWSGGGAKSTLTIGNAAASAPDVMYCFQGECRSSKRIENKKHLENVRFADGALKFKWGGTFKFELDDETLKGKYLNPRGRTFTIRMTRPL